MYFCQFGLFSYKLSQGLPKLLLVSLAKLTVKMNFSLFSKVPQRWNPAE